MWTRGRERLCQLPRMPGKPRPKWNHLGDKEALWKVPSCSGRGEAADHVERVEGAFSGHHGMRDAVGRGSAGTQSKDRRRGQPSPQGPALFLTLLWGEHVTRDPASPGLVSGNTRSVVDTGTPLCSRAPGLSRSSHPKIYPPGNHPPTVSLPQPATTVLFLASVSLTL